MNYTGGYIDLEVNNDHFSKMKWFLLDDKLEEENVIKKIRKNGIIKTHK